MNGFYTIVFLRTESQHEDLVRIAIVLYDIKKAKTYVRPLIEVDELFMHDLAALMRSLGKCRNIEDLVEFIDKPRAPYFLRHLEGCKILSRPGKTLDAIYKKEFGKQ